MKFTGERYIPSEQGEVRVEHMHRYAAVQKVAADKDVLDVACGEGYGARLLAASARSVTGVDISEEAVRHAAALTAILRTSLSARPAPRSFRSPTTRSTP